MSPAAASPAIPLANRPAQLLPGLFQQRFQLNQRYLTSLTVENLVQNFALEAGRTGWQLHSPAPERHWGWESPSSQIRGHFLGHWLSAAGKLIALTGDRVVAAHADAVLAELAQCQERHGGSWLGPSSEKYLTWLAQGTPTWAPQYVHHKTLMGLYDFHASTGDARALTLADRFADWFDRWTQGFTRAQMDDILDVETGGMLEVWANLYGSTHADKYLRLMERYTRARLFDPLLAGQDPLTNMHANTTIPEAQGAARCYEVTGDVRWRQIVEAYWHCAVTARGTFCTGSQTSGEIWTPPFAFAARRGQLTQEHCVVYNLIRLADYLYRWTGAPVYLDYVERNLYNGILAQQSPSSGMVTYYLPLAAGAKKKWGHPTHDFWCCHGSLVQAHTLLPSLIYYQEAAGLVVAQYIPSEGSFTVGGTAVTLRQIVAPRAGHTQALTPQAACHQVASRPASWCIKLAVTCAAPVAFTLTLRLPAWLSGPAKVDIDGTAVPLPAAPTGLLPLHRRWERATVTIELPTALTLAPIPDEPDTVAFLDGPVVLAGLSEREVTLYGDPAAPATLLVPDDERSWGNWHGTYRTVGQPTTIRFRPLYEIDQDPYTLYFPLRRGAPAPADRP